MRDPVLEFQKFNRDLARRNAELLRLKVERMAASPFAFYRGTFHLYARDILEHLHEGGPPSAAAAELDLVGDIHSENYGTFRANSCVHYDINDFDETTQGRPDFDVRRLATSLVLAAQERRDALADAAGAGLAVLTSYAATVRRFLKKGKLDQDVSEESPSGCAPLDRLLKAASASKRPVYINSLTELSKGRRTLIRSLRYFNLPEGERQQALRLLDDFRKRQPPPPVKDFFAPEDACGRVSGIGSMGRLRYVVLVAGKGTKEARNVLLEFKEARPSAYDLYRGRCDDPQALLERAERVVAAQRLSQAASPPWLGFAVDGGQSFQVREIGPHARRLEARELKDAAELHAVAGVLAAILARAHARAAARAVGVANPLAELQDEESYCQRLLAFALAYADQARQDWKLFVGRRNELDRCEQWSAA
jgi:uncharacterized protein (DUF2252 family)